MSSPAQSSSGDKIETAADIDRVFLRLVVADTDAKLQRFTDRHLADILGFAGKSPSSVPQVMELLTHYNKMVKNNLAIQFPVAELMGLFQGDSAVASNLSLIYLKFARDRISSQMQIEIVPVYLNALSKKLNDISFSYEIIALCLPGLQQLSLLDKQKWPIELNLAPETIGAMAKVFRGILTFRAADLEQIKVVLARISSNANVACAGMSPEEYSLVARKVVGDNLNLTENKLTIVRLLTQGIFDDKTAFPLLVLASAANINAVDDAAESALKKVDIQEIIDDVKVINSLMAAYLGSAAEAKKPESVLKTVQGANVFAKQKILTFLTRSKTAPTVYMNNIKICIDGIGSDVARVQNNALMFLHTIIEKMPPTALKSLGPTLFGRLKKMVRPVTQNNASLCLIYRCLGSLGKAQPQLVFGEISVVNELLSTIPEEEEDVGYSIVDCLVAWLPAFCQSRNEENVSNQLKLFISEHVTHENTKCRMVSLKYIEALIDVNEMDLKWMLLRASGDLREEMRQEAVRLLELSLRRNVPTIPLVVSTFWGYLKDDVQAEDGTEQQTSKAKNNALIHQMCSKYLWAVCETIVMEKAAEMRIVEGDDHWMVVSPRIVKMISETFDIETVIKMAKLTVFATRESLDVHQYRIATCFVTCLLSSPVASKETKITSTRFPLAIANCALKVRDSTRMELSQAITFLLSTILAVDDKMRYELYEANKKEMVDKAIPGLCWSVAGYITPIQLNAEQYFSNAIIIKIGVEGVDLMYKFVKEGYERPSSILEAALGAIGFVMQNHIDTVLALPAYLKEGLLEMSEKIASSRKDSFSQKARESAVRIIGWMVAETSNDSFVRSVGFLYKIGEGPPQPELQLTVGEALIDSMIGEHSYSRRNCYSTKEEDINLQKVVTNAKESELLQSRIAQFVMTVIDEKLTSENHHLRRAGLVWLMVLVQRMSKLGAVAFTDSSCLSSIQNAFADGLTENDEFTQDIASKGMGVVYAVADADLRKELVSNLMGALSEGRRVERKIDGGTVLFEKGQLGKTPTGDNLTTYKELCTLATDLNQPDLVYKFMQLAKHNATWNAKKGAAFGFGAVLEQAKDELEPYFGHLVPKLFRYRYDPDLKVQASMRSIWSVLTANRRNVVDEFANEIAKELLPSLTNKEWRVRESACLALSDLLRGHDTPEMHKLVPEYLDTVLRVRDDIKESVRLAADKTAESIRRLVVRLASSTNAARADEFLATVLPMIVDQGIVQSTVKANKVYCLALTLEMAKTAGKQLKPYLDRLIPILLDSISDNESAVLNYVAVRSDSAQLEALDDARARMARTSPMMTAINDLLPHIDSDVLVAMTPKICEQLRASVGVSTRSASAQLITQLALRAPQLMLDHKPQCDKLFNALIPGVRDRNPSIRKQFANAMSYLAKFVSSGHMMTLVKGVVADLVTENDDLKQSARHVLRNLSANCSELLAGYATQIVPYVFLETCQEVPKGDETARLKNEEWTELWAELVPSTSSAARLYKNEIVNTAIGIVKNNEVWTVRAQAARMIGKTADALGDNIGVETVDLIVKNLIPALSGRIWAGKEEILTALAKSFQAGGEDYRKALNAEDSELISHTLMREASRKNPDYSSKGLAAVARYCNVVGDVKTAEWLAEKVEKNVEKAVGSGDKDEESDDEMTGLTNLEKEIRISKIVTSNLTALIASLATFRNGSDAVKTIDQIVRHMKNSSIAWKSKQNMFVELSETIAKWQLTSAIECSELVLAIFEQADEMCSQQKKTVAADALQVIIRMAERRDLFRVDWSMVAERMENGTAGVTTGLANRLVERMDVE